MLNAHQAASGINLNYDQPQIEPMFGYGPTIDGYEVVALDTGRPVTAPYDTAQQANGRAQQLNAIAANGPRALARALRAS